MANIKCILDGNKSNSTKISKSIIDGVDILQFGNNSNYIVVKDQLENHLATYIGQRSSFIDTGAYMNIPPPTLESVNEAYPGMSAASKADILKVIITEHAKSYARWLDNKAKAYSNIISILSETAANVMASHAEFEIIKKNKDPLALWKLITRIHANAANGNNTDLMNIIQIKNMYYKLVKLENQSLIDFKRKFIMCINNMTSAGCTEIPSAATQATDFISKLDETYKELFVSISNGVTRGLETWPTTVEASYKLAAAFLPSERLVFNNNTAGRENVFNYAQEVSNNKRGNYKNNHKNNNNDTNKTIGVCNNCGEKGHWKNNCPQLNKNNKNNKHYDNSNKTNNNGNNNHNHHKKKHNTYNNSSNNKNTHNNNKKRNEINRSVNLTTETTANDSDSDNDVGFSCFVKCSNSKWDSYDIIFDTGATTNVVNNLDILMDIMNTHKNISINGIGGELSSKVIGTFPMFGKATYYTDIPVNILCANEIASKYKVDIELDDCITVHVNKDMKLEFKKNTSNLYVCNIKNIVNKLKLLQRDQYDILMYENNNSCYSNKDYKKATLVKHIMRRLGYISTSEMAKIITSGTMINLPITLDDLARCVDIFGKDVAELQGKSVWKQQPNNTTVAVNHEVEMLQNMYIDIMYIAEIPYVISVFKPLNHLGCEKINGRPNKDNILNIVNNQMKLLTNKGFKINKIYTDAGSNIACLKLHINSIYIDNSARGSHVNIVERAIRFVKERVRCVLAGIPYNLPNKLSVWAVLFVIDRINCLPRSSGINISPREVLKGRKLNYSTDVRLQFGEYVSVYQPYKHHNSVTNTRTVQCIALCPKDNEAGSWYFFNLETKSITTGDQFSMLKINEDVIEKINNLYRNRTTVNNIDDDLNVPRVRKVTVTPSIGDNLQLRAMVDQHNTGIVDVNDNDVNINNNIGVEAPTQTSSSTDHQTQIINTNNENTEVIIPQQNNNTYGNENINENNINVSNNDNNVDYHHEEDVNNNNTDVHIDNNGKPSVGKSSISSLGSTTTDNVRKSYRVLEKKVVKNNNDIVNHLSLKKGLDIYNNDAKSSMRKEIQQLVEKDVWKVLTLKERKKIFYKEIIRSSMFYKEKFDSVGNFIKLKCRLVAGGNEQDPTVYTNNSSPTVSMEAVNMVLAIAASKDQYIYAVDVEGAYLEASIEEDNVYMMLQKEVVSEYVNMYPNEKIHVDDKGKLLVKLKKALYGCKQSSKLWYNKLKSTLEQIEFVQNKMEQCVFNLKKNNVTITTCFHVDDLLFTCNNEQMLTNVVQQFGSKFRGISIQKGNNINYLGLNIHRNRNKDIELSMIKYSKDIGESCGITQKDKTPNTETLFEDDNDESIFLTEDNRKIFHTIVAKLLYLAKKLRPDILTAISYLASKVNQPTVNDNNKLTKVVKYVNNTINYKSIYKYNTPIGITAYVDASFGCHSDGKSRSGIAVMLCGGMIYTSSSKQKIVTKSSTEAELVALSDACDQIQWCIEFIKYQGLITRNNVILEDNKSTITLIKTGKTSKRTRHIKVKYFGMKELIDNNILDIVYCETENMYADILTKPTVGRKFINLRDMVCKLE
tara:strand:- start:307 stop:5016 length:4710 start_codon:yes stop_codon:yes gene_type:complete